MGKTVGIDPAGCKADGVHEECRFCGAEGFHPCPKCELKDEPEAAVVWDNKCKIGEYTKGCLADGIHFPCRRCGTADYDACPLTTPTTTTRSTVTRPTEMSATTVAPDGYDTGALSGARRFGSSRRIGWWGAVSIISVVILIV